MPKGPGKADFFGAKYQARPEGLGLQIKHTERRIGSTNTHEWARIKKIIFRPADRRPESFIPLLWDKSFVVFLPCRKAMAFACQPLIAGRQKENQFVFIREHSWTNICFFH
ncbi:hypothetical protein AKJ60_01035 [candidate division MSBL1 archaeon SCGC-AAA385M11]|nr:hypothetical protein AKJ60_01035 [candidate division MSBL1 archaeon SCGC-AAA385M11]